VVSSALVGIALDDGYDYDDNNARDFTRALRALSNAILDRVLSHRARRYCARWSSASLHRRTTVRSRRLRRAERLHSGDFTPIPFGFDDTLRSG
jgi:hypothetical protein